MGSFNNRKLLPELNSTIFCCFNCSSCSAIFIPPIHIVIESKKTEHISSLLIIIIALLGGCFLLVTYYAIIVRYCSKLNTSRRPRPQIEVDADTYEDFVDENHGPVVDHPIWYINTVGLAQSVIDSIAVFEYKKGEGLVEGTDCSICLSEFEDGETLRLLPKCSHAFHLPCIDTWLRSHTNCPSCRAPIVSSPVVSGSSGNLNNSGIGEDARVETSESDGVLGAGQNGEDGVSDLTVRVQDEMEGHDRRRDVEISKKDLLSPLELSGFRVFSDLSDNHRVMQNGRQPVRRSASMDFNPASIFCFSVANSLPLEEDEDEDEDDGSSIVPLQRGKKGNLTPGLSRLMGSSSKGRFLPKSPVSMKRSVSSGSKLTLSRSSRNRSSILPL